MISGRRDIVLSNSTGFLRPNSGTSITVLPPGAKASAGSSSTSITVYQGHSFRNGDKLVNWMTGAFRTINAVPTATGLSVSVALTVSIGDILLNLGPDTGTTTPNWDASPVKIWNNPDGTSAVTNSTVSTSSEGEYSYFHALNNAWEVARVAATAATDAGTAASILDVTKGISASIKVNVLDYGAKGDGSTDDTNSIKAAVLAITGGGVLSFPPGTFILNDDDPTKGIVLPSNSRLELDPACTVKRKATSASAGALVWINSVSNVVVTGGTLDGNRSGYTGASEFGMGVQINGGTNITVEDVVISNNYGDGVYISSATQGVPPNSTNIVLNGVRCSNNRRNGLSVVAVNGLRATGCSFDSTNGTSPQCGVDIEPSTSDLQALNVVFDNCTANSNTGEGFQIVETELSAPLNLQGISLVGCTATGNTGSGVKCQQTQSRILISGCHLYGNGSMGVNCNDGDYVDIIGNIVDSNSSGILVTSTSTGTLVSGNSVTSSTNHGIWVLGNGSADPVDCVVSGNKSSFNGQNGLFMDRCHRINVTGNSFTSNGRNGILMATVVDSNISCNAMYNNGTSASTPIYDGINVQSASSCNNNIISANTSRKTGTTFTQRYGIAIGTGCTSNVLLANDVTTGGVTANILNGGTTTILRHNSGFVTEASGTATILSGTTSIAVTHGLAVTPALKDIMVMMAENPTNDAGLLWVSGVGATQFTVNCRSDPGASNLDVAWRAEVL